MPRTARLFLAAATWVVGLASATAALAGEPREPMFDPAPGVVVAPTPAPDAAISSAKAEVDEGPSNDRLGLRIGTGAGPSVAGDDGHSAPAGLGGGTMVAFDGEYGHVFHGWFEIGLGMLAQHNMGSTLSAYRPYATMRAFTTAQAAEFGVALHAGPAFFHFAVDGKAYDLSSFAPSLVFDTRIWLGRRFALVGGIELLATGATISAPGAPNYLDRSQLWDVGAIASLGVSMRL